MCTNFFFGARINDLAVTSRKNGHGTVKSFDIAASQPDDLHGATTDLPRGRRRAKTFALLAVALAAIASHQISAGASPGTIPATVANKQPSVMPTTDARPADDRVQLWVHLAAAPVAPHMDRRERAERKQLIEQQQAELLRSLARWPSIRKLGATSISANAVAIEAPKSAVADIARLPNVVRIVPVSDRNRLHELPSN
jgi:hypothetical protein